MNRKAFYITTTLPYVNAKPHIGFAREIVQADVLARFQRSLGKEVFFNTGTDEHGQKIFQKAEENGLDPQAYCDELSRSFQKLKNKDVLNLSYDRFIRTTDADHVEAAKEFWRICDEKGYIEKKKYKIKYCVGCELEKTDSDLIDGRCPDHPNVELETREEENYFFRFSQFGDKLSNFYEKDPNFVKPKKRFNEILKFVEGGLADFSISRLKEKMPWGIEVPGDSEHVMYVWFDALVSYISTIGWPDEKYKKFWDEAVERVQFCGKDNLRQQSAMWQAMLMVAEISNSTRVFVNGFINVGGQKMSKSLGNVISPEEMVEKYGTDGTRYLLLCAGSFGEDTDITWEKLDDKYNADLANGLGNLVSRVVKLGEEIKLEIKVDKEKTLEINRKYLESEFSPEESLKRAWGLIKSTDKFMEKNKPWELKKTDKDEFWKVMKEVLLRVAQVADLIEPFLPETSEKIKKALKTKKSEPLFKRI